MSLDRSRRRILIVGAGPTGLTLALELARHGFHPEIIDRNSEPSLLSRAVGINPRSLELLEPSGLTSKLVRAGIRLEGITIFDEDKRVGALRFELLHHRYNFMLALPQRRTEELLIKELEGFGIGVRWDTALEHLDADIEGIEVRLAGGRNEGLYEYVVGCDGVGSTVRQAAGIDFSGYAHSDRWSVADFFVKTPLEDMANARLRVHADGTAFFTIPLGRNHVRAVCSRPNIRERLEAFDIDTIGQSGAFEIQVCQARAYRRGCIFLAGDAAHCHSPAGGRGMNLGIGDACMLANCMTAGRLNEYEALRKPLGAAVLKQSERLARLATMTGEFKRGLRNRTLGIIGHLPLLERWLVYREVSGLGERDL